MELPGLQAAQICDRISPYYLNFNFPNLGASYGTVQMRASEIIYPINITSLPHPSIASDSITTHFMAIYCSDGSDLLRPLDDA